CAIKERSLRTPIRMPAARVAKPNADNVLNRDLMAVLLELVMYQSGARRSPGSGVDSLRISRRRPGGVGDFRRSAENSPPGGLGSAGDGARWTPTVGMNSATEDGMTTFTNRLMGAATLDDVTYEDIEHDPRATMQALTVVILASVAVGIGSAGIGH